MATTIRDANDLAKYFVFHFQNYSRHEKQKKVQECDFYLFARRLEGREKNHFVASSHLRHIIINKKVNKSLRNRQKIYKLCVFDLMFIIILKSPNFASCCHCYGASGRDICWQKGFCEISRFASALACEWKVHGDEAQSR